MKTSKNAFKIFTAAVLAIGLLFITGCASIGPNEDPASLPEYMLDIAIGDEFTDFEESPFLSVKKYPDSYFAADVSTASYSVLRRYINQEKQIGKTMVKIEEMINYFKYDYPAPKNNQPFSMTGSIYPCPWNSQNQLFAVGLKAKDIQLSDIKNNLVFLIDTSGSMLGTDRLGLLKEAFSLMVDNLNDDDRISLVTYAGSAKTLLSGVKGSERVTIKSELASLEASGSTAGAAGIQTAYEIAEANFIVGGNNRVILATDGDFNVGIKSQDQLKSFISGKRASGVYLSIFGVGMGNYKNTTMDTLALSGNGSAYYIDSRLEAKKVMAEELSGTLVTVADDVKTMVSFNEDKISSYRLLGYETKLLSKDEWLDDRADAGEIGAGHCVTAVYEIVPAVTASEVSSHQTMGDNWIKSSVRYKQPFSDLESRPKTDTREVKEIEKSYGFSDILSMSEFETNEDLMLISAVIEFALILRDSDYKASASLNAVTTRLNGLASVTGQNKNVYRADFLDMVNNYKRYMQNR